MKIEPIDEIIPLTIGNPQVEENLNRFSLLIVDVRNLGSIFIGEIFKDDKGINKYVRSVVTCFLRQIIEDMDAISILINKSSADPCFLNLRRLFENHIYLKYILKEKCEERAKAYYVNHLINKRKIAEKEDASTNQGKILREKLKKDELSENFSIPTKECKSETDKIDKILQEPQYQYLKTEFDKQKEIKRTHWYSLDNKSTSLERLSDFVGCSGRYEALYRYFSQYSHSENELDNIDWQEAGQARLVQIRNPEHAQLITQLTLTYGLDSFRIAIQTLKPSCLKCFTQFYKENIEFNSSELRNKKLINVIWASPMT